MAATVATAVVVVATAATAVATAATAATAVAVATAATAATAVAVATVATAVVVAADVAGNREAILRIHCAPGDRGVVLSHASRVNQRLRRETGGEPVTEA